MYDGDHTVTCDLCGLTLDVPGDARSQLIAAEAGWSWSTPRHGPTFHVCPGCQARRGAEVRRRLRTDRATYEAT